MTTPRVQLPEEAAILFREALHPSPAENALLELDKLYQFLKKAFAPGPSEKHNPDRFDVLLNLALHNPPDPEKGAKILDLGSGDCLLLEKLLKSHKKKKHYKKPLRYVAIDRIYSSENPRWKSLERQAKVCDRSCFACLKLINFDMHQHEILSCILGGLGETFNIIYLSNVLHEIDPSGLFNILNVIARYLDQDGRIVVLDPAVEWCLAPWPDNVSIEHVKVEWEAEAVWYSAETITEVLEAAGFSVSDPTEAERTSNLWQVVGTVHPSREASCSEAHKIIEAFVSSQLETEAEKCVDLRHHVKAGFVNSGNMTPELVSKFMEFFCVCASQHRRLEVLRKLSQ